MKVEQFYHIKKRTVKSLHTEWRFYINDAKDIDDDNEEYAEEEGGKTLTKTIMKN